MKKEKVNILMVCLGNICRSPVADGIMRKKAKVHNLKIKVDSAGTSGYHNGENPDRRSQQNALKNGVDISNLISRKFTVEDFDDFDLIYVMDSSNQRDVLSLSRNENDRNKVSLILNELYPGENRSVPDPYFGGEDGFENVFRMLDEACEKIALKLLQSRD